MSAGRARLRQPPDIGTAFVPTGGYRGILDEYGYVEEEWLASGEADGHAYTTTVIVRRPTGSYSGTLIVEPWHAMSAAPIWIYTSLYQMREGHAWACLSSQKSVLDGFVKPSDPGRYEQCQIWSDIAPVERGFAPMPRDPAQWQARMEHMRRLNICSTPILAQGGTALRGLMPETKNLILVGHSQTGGVVTDYVLNGPAGVYDGYFPSGAPSVQFGPREVPLVQVLTEGDISDPNRPGREGRRYRRDDSDDPADLYRLYELAGLGHMGTRYPPYSETAMWLGDPTGTAGQVPSDATMNSLPHSELFQVCLDHLVRWVAEGKTPPRADRIEAAEDGLFAKDEAGNSRGGVRCTQLDVPRLRYLPNPSVDEKGVPAFGVVGVEQPLAKDTLAALYSDHFEYVERFNRRVDELIAEGWLLPEDAAEMRAEAEKAEVP